MDNQNQIQIKDPFAGAEYANVMNINSSKEEFLLNFFNIAGANGRVVGKIIVSPRHLKRMSGVLTKVLKDYEEKFGKLEEANEPNTEIGFKAE
ncbi:MAG: DUF3467 domain-containing protein [Patescibacteria group bacterium]|nr:DUF3467 domain-containing protein [Patescibacteria group bacterium]